MIKKITILAFFFVCVGAVAATKMYVDTEQKYIFTAENLAQTIPDFVTDDAAQVAMAKKYTDIMNQETGAVSVADLFAICRAGGMNTYRAAGFETCRNFVTKLLENASVEFDAESFGGFCPGLDENGKNPNALRSITDKTQVGDFCSSQNIAAGDVVFRRGYNCTCAAYACNPGYESKGGACVTIVADANGDCKRQVYTVSDKAKYKTGEALKFCESKAVGGCKIRNALRHFPSAGQITCNADQSEYDSVVSKTKARNTPCPEQAYPASAQNKNNTNDLCGTFCSAKATENNCKLEYSLLKTSTKQCVCNPGETALSSASLYRYVCAGDKGQTGGTERCVDNVFNWTNVQMLQAVALAQSYARQKYNQSIVCSNKYRKSNNDDYLQCRATVGKTYYEFQFDDIKETWDSTIDHNVRKALCEGVYGGDIITFGNGDACQDISQATCTKLNTSAAKFGYKVTWTYSQMKKKNICMFGDAIENGEKLAQVDGIDPYHFFEGIQIQANRSLIDSLKSYVQTVYGAKLTSFTCLNHFRHVAKIENHVTKGASEDILRCTINGKTDVDFVFDDTSEFADTLSEGGYQNIDCRVIGGEYNGHDCMYLNKQQCEKLSSLNATKCPTCKKIRWDGTYCVMPSAADATELQNTLNNAAIAGGIALGLIVTAATGGAGGAVVLATIEMAGSMVELVSTMDIQDKIAQFLKDSQRCQNAQCAERMLANDLQRMANLSSDATDAQIVGIDAEFARLVELIPSDSAFYKKIMAQGTSVAANQKGIFDPDSWEPEQMWRAIGLTAQLTSIGKSIFGWAGRKLTKATAAVRTGLRNAGHATNATGAASRNASRAADATTDAERVAGNATRNSTRTTADTAADATRNSTRTADTATDAARTADTATDAGRAADDVGGVSQTKSFEERAEFVDFDKGVDEFNRSGVSMSIPDEAFTPDEWAALNRRAASKGVEVLEDGHGGRYFSRIGTAADNVADAASDAARTVARTAETVTDAGRAADGVGESFRGMSYEERLKHIEFNKGLDEFKRGGPSMIFPDEALSPQEWAALKRSLAGDGIELVYDEKYAFWSFKRIGSAADNVADAATDAARTGARTADTAVDAARTADTAADAATDAGRAADDVGEAFRGMSYEERLKHIEFNKGLDEFKRNGVSMIFPDEALSPQEWAALKRSLAGDGIELVYDEKYAFWSFKRIGSAADNVADAATDAARTGARTADAATDAGRAATHADDAMRVAANADLSSLQGRAEFEFFEDVLADFKRYGHTEGITFDRSMFSSDEWTQINRYLAADNVQVVRSADGDMVLRKVSNSADRTSLKSRIANGDRVSGGIDNVDINVSQGEFARAYRNEQGEVVVLADSKYKFINELVGQDVELEFRTINGKVYYDQPVNASRAQVNKLERLLSQNDVKYFKQNGQIIFSESEVEKLGMRDTKIDLYHAHYSAMDDRRLREANLVTNEQINANEDEFFRLALDTNLQAIDAAKDAVNIEDLTRVADTTRKNIINLVVNDKNLLNVVKNFDTANESQKMKFAQKIVDEMGLKDEVFVVRGKTDINDPFSVATNAEFRLRPNDEGKYILALYDPAMTVDIDHFVGLVTHEANHAVDILHAEKGAIGEKLKNFYERFPYDGQKAYQYGVVETSEEIDHYYLNLLPEQSSHYIGNYVRDGFKEDVMKHVKQ